jgi:hypothetical protein
MIKAVGPHRIKGRVAMLRAAAAGAALKSAGGER